MRISDWSSDVCSSDLWMSFQLSMKKASVYAWTEIVADSLLRYHSLGDETIDISVGIAGLTKQLTGMLPQCGRWLTHLGRRPREMNWAPQSLGWTCLRVVKVDHHAARQRLGVRERLTYGVRSEEH